MVVVCVDDGNEEEEEEEVGEEVGEEAVPCSRSDERLVLLRCWSNETVSSDASSDV